MPKDRPSTRAVLLDVAERLFAEHGYDGASLRLIASEAHANLGAVNYHFATKQALYTETFLRRFRPVNVERARRLTLACQAAGDAPISAECLLDCLLRPAFEAARQHPTFAQLLGRNLMSPPSFFRETVAEEMTFIIGSFGPEFRRTVPEISPERIFMRLHLCAGALLFMAAVPPPPVELSGIPISGPDAAYAELLAFTTAGFLAELPSRAP